MKTFMTWGESSIGPMKLSDRVNVKTIGQYVELSLQVWFVGFMIVLSSSLAWAQPESIEYKLQVHSHLFVGTPAEGYRSLPKAIEETGRQYGLKVHLSPFKEGSLKKGRYIYFWDTPQRDLRSHQLLLRQEFKAYPNSAQSKGSLVLKWRRNEPMNETEQKAFMAGLKDETKRKYEADVLGLLDNQEGHSRTDYSISVKMKTICAGNQSLAWLEKRFPYLETLNWDRNRLLEGLYEPIYSSETVVAELKSEGERIPMNVVFWYDVSGRELKTVELSWKDRLKKGKPDVLLEKWHRVLQSHTDVFSSGQMKSEINRQ